MTVHLEPLDAAWLAWAQDVVTRDHYLASPVPHIARPEGYSVGLNNRELPRLGCLIVSRPQATRCGDWYGGVEDVAAGRCEVTRWQVLALSRVWLSHAVQEGSRFSFYSPAYLPGFVDRRGVWRSTLASEVLRLLVLRVGYDYLLRRPPVFLDEPYEIKWLLSYCDRRVHKGTIYRAAGWELYRTNDQGIETWRTPLPSLTTEQCVRIAAASLASERGRRYRAARRRAEAHQLALEVA